MGGSALRQYETRLFYRPSSAYFAQTEDEGALFPDYFPLPTYEIRVSVNATSSRNSSVGENDVTSFMIASSVIALV